MNYRTTTQSPEVNELMQALLDSLLDLLGPRLAGLYLTGSLALGDFRPESSDIDFVVATRGLLGGEAIAQLARMHGQLRGSTRLYSNRMEGDYVPLEAIRRYDPHHFTYPHLGVDGHFAVERHDSNEVIQWAVLREHGIVLYGLPPDAIMDEISPQQIRTAERDFLREWWRPQLQDPHRLEDAEYQAYTVLTMCRILYTLEFGRIVSKSQAARWAALEFPQYAGLISLAEKWRRGSRFNERESTLDMLRFVLDRGAPE